MRSGLGLGPGRLSLLIVSVLFVLTRPAAAQAAPQERTFTQSKVTVEKALKAMPASFSGPLPTLEGFAAEGNGPLERFKRPYYQCSVEVKSNAAGGSLVRVSAKITAWYADTIASRSGYRVLSSNGRLESDVLNQLEEMLGSPRVPAGNPPAPATSSQLARHEDVGEPAISAPEPNLPKTADPLAGAMGRIAKGTKQPVASEKSSQNSHIEQLRSELKNLQEILNNQSHPNNLVAVKKPGTPVLSGPRLDAKILFYTTVEDEFEILDTTSDWVHVRISGLSRGWIRRSSVEMPENEETSQTTAGADAQHSEPFFVTREETAPFSGDWEPLRGKMVRIIFAQKTDEGTQETPQAKLEFITALLGKRFQELAQASPVVAGVLVIFDSADGGMMATTLPTLQEWKAGRLSTGALWQQCYFDPPDTFTMSSNR